MKSFRCLPDASVFALSLFAFSIFPGSTLFAQTDGQTAVSPVAVEKVLASFNGANGLNPGNENLVQGLDGNLYGTTGDSECCGTIFKITTGGTLTTIHTFSGADGAYLYGGLTLGVDGNFYGVTYEGGTMNYGTVFRITPSGTLTTLHSFTNTDGGFPSGGLIQGTDGNFYGTTYGGGKLNYGTVFKINPSGRLTTLHNFDYTYGAYPAGALVEATDGSFYGTTSSGSLNYGTVFAITSSGFFTPLQAFESTNGADPQDQLALVGGNYYGTARLGGANGDGEVFLLGITGLNVLHSFDGADGSAPWGSLIEANDGNLYGTTEGGGANSLGTVFQITTGGSLSTIYSFGSGDNDGISPIGGLVQHTSGVFFGTTNGGGAALTGTVFSLNVGLRPFLILLPGSGKVGSKVTILGTHLAGVSNVSFDRIPATFTQTSSTYVTAIVPTGAKSGIVEVTTSSGTLKSFLPFSVH